MGNNIGFEADEESVKLAYVEVNESNIEFVRGLESRFLISEFKWGQATAFLFQCSIEEFLHYPTSHNVKLLRDQYISMLAGDKFLIKTNRQTISKIKRLRKLEEAL